MNLNPAGSQSALAAQFWPFDLGWLPQSAHLVGGCVRDALLGRALPYLDLDFVLPEGPVETAQAIAQQYQAGFVLLDDARQIARVVFPQATADFALQVGGSLDADLRRRDFTINAIAYNPHTQAMIDPLHGKLDLEQGLIRMIQVQNLVEDPLRLLRAYRQAAQLGFGIDPQTQHYIRQLAPRLHLVAAERVRVELSYLLHHPQGLPWLTILWQDGLLNNWFPNTTATGLQLLAAIDQATERLTPLWPTFVNQLNLRLNDRALGAEAARRTMLATTKLVGFLAPDAQQAKRTLQHLTYSRLEIDLVTTLLQCLPRCQLMLATDYPTRRDLFNLFQAAGTAFPALAVLSIASGTSIDMMAPLIDEYIDPESAIAHPQPLITGKTLIKALRLHPGPEMGKLLSALELAQADGKISTAQEALDLAKVLWRHQCE